MVRAVTLKIKRSATSRPYCSAPRAKFCGVRHTTDSAALSEVLPAGLDCSCFKVACFEVLSAFRSQGGL